MSASLICPNEAAGLGGHAEEHEDILGHVIGFDRAMELMEAGESGQTRPRSSRCKWLAMHRLPVARRRRPSLEFAGAGFYPFGSHPLVRKTPHHAVSNADLAAAVGNTPLIRLNKVSEATGCEILGKAEFLNPGQSVKDRAALFIIPDAIAKGHAPGRWHHFVEGTADKHRPSALRWWAPPWGFRTVIVIPETQRPGKRRT